ncbi:hypothetical protein N7499_010522 [Penicillium canescens]|uniref:GPI anchored protein n=1 Tax=Penicillium canescens TaxID=5083 RepID=A0AAD6IIF1_PENCN|nr:uncharacterized protein N7446_005790 [Penicillium canescens]KAJ5989997.1 hypothetical protein N7522_010204 [Penicillium canescens]KAJ6051159.1 hypothetical protein N7460_001693 [Penicillium canescens]KAJ6061670.1 hypothetical protein N7446_005790 [Penicillium canescens]KAJ6064918.1 hypothetical protein N7444_000571 [Penicillium canescens]KAJ6068635.1 hypothetical protein N7499_010522 [Penicillium canescens]
MRVQSFALLVGATAAVAAETVTLFLPGFDEQKIDGKVIGSSGSMTSYAINCAPGTESDDCGLPPNGMTVIQGSSSVILSYDMSSMIISENCKFDSSTASCSASVNEGGLTTTWASVIPITSIPGGALMAVTVTATETGASATTGASVSASTAVSTGSSSLTTSASTSGSTATGTNTAGSSDSSSAAATSHSGTGNAAMPMVTGNARWAAGGVAAALALAAI